MNLARGIKIGLGVVLILVGSAAIFSSVDEHLLGGWTGTVMGFHLVPFLLIFGGLWLAFGGHLKGLK